MGVLLDVRIYQVLAILSAQAVAGFCIWAVRTWRRRETVLPQQWAEGSLLVACGLAALASYLWYNTQFVQHQSRYLFNALVPISLAMALGWREALGRKYALGLAAMVLAGAGVLWLAGLLPNWPLLMLVATAVALVIRRFLPGRLDPLVHAVPYLLLVVLDLVSLFAFIVPQLAG
jgi:hypothetical protein